MSNVIICNPEIDWFVDHNGTGEDIDLTDDGGAIIAVDNGQFGFLKINYVQDILNGDLNNDNSINVLDVVLMVNVILSDNFLNDADLNQDGAINVLDVVNLINIILN